MQDHEASQAAQKLAKWNGDAVVAFPGHCCGMELKLFAALAVVMPGIAGLGFEGVQLSPTTFFMDKRGHIVHKYRGEPDFDELHVLLDRLSSAPA